MEIAAKPDFLVVTFPPLVAEIARIIVDPKPSASL
jgi:hypothetical protein